MNVSQNKQRPTDPSCKSNLTLLKIRAHILIQFDSLFLARSAQHTLLEVCAAQNAQERGCQTELKCVLLFSIMLNLIYTTGPLASVCFEKHSHSVKR